MAAMDSLALVQRFIRLPATQRQAFFEKLESKGMSFSQLPIPACSDGFESIPLSYAQERQWFLWQFEPASGAYNIPLALRLRGALDVPALARSLTALCARHRTLRTTFSQGNPQARQQVHPVQPWALSVTPCTEDQLQGLIDAQVQQPFDLQAGPLLRTALFQCAADQHVLVLALHHIVADGWSLQVMTKELLALYAAHSQGLEPQLPALPIQYADYAIWQRCWMDAGERARQLQYWQNQLGSQQPVLELPTDYPRPLAQSYRGAKFDVPVDASLSAALQALAQRENVTLFMLLLALFQALLARYSGQSDIRVGVPVANRNRVETEGLIGFFVNTQVLRSEVDSQASLRVLLQQAKQAALGAQAHQDLPFEQLVQALHPSRSLSHSPLFQVMYNHQASARAGADALPVAGLQIEGLGWENHTAKYDLTLDTTEDEGQLSATFTYATDLFVASTIERLAGHWLNLLRAVVRNPDARVGEVPMLDAAEAHSALLHNNAAAFAGRCVHEHIQARAAHAPEAIAVVSDEQTLSYGQLNAQANRLAHKLRELGVGPDVLVGIALERGPQMVVGLLAILKAGGAYVPMDPQYPAERLAHMIEDSGLHLLLTQAHLRDSLPIPAGVAALDIDADWSGYSATDPQVALDPQHLAYVIYTSGSTGKPKGVAVRHEGVANFLASMTREPGITAGDRVLALTSLSFDIAGLELYAPLIEGACLVLVSGADAKDPQALIRLIVANEVSLVQATPSTWRMLLDAQNAAQLPACKVLCGGEALPADLAQRLIARFGHVWNLYGPTETTIWSAIHRLDATQPKALLGKAIDHTNLYVLDSDLQPVPRGVVGELYIGGIGLARGYHRRAGLTAERFMADPFTTQGARMYRSGDLVRISADGLLDYVGRADHQVKIRGFRIELGEIETRLQALEGVREAVVVAHDNVLSAYLVPRDPAVTQLDAGWREQLKAALLRELPDFMLPSHWMLLARMPHTPNGKLDRKALPRPNANLLLRTYEAPQSQLEQQVAGIWQDVLKLQRVGLNDNFFELGGHSLLATQVVSRLAQTLGLDVPLRNLFEHSSLRAFVQSLWQVEAQPTLPMLAIDRQQPLPLSYAQERQWVLWQLQPRSTAYTIPAALRLRGRLDLGALEQSFSALVARHEPLRTTFEQHAEGVRQVIHPPSPLIIGVQPIEPAHLDERLETLLGQPFNLYEGPLLRVNLLQLGVDDQVLVLAMHHIVTDGWSMQLMVDELLQSYAAFSQGLYPERPALAVQYADYAVWQRQWMAAGERERQLEYWQEQLGGPQPVLELPTDYPRPAQQSYAGAQLAVPIGAELATAIKQVALREGVTVFMLFLASFQVLLHRYSGQGDIRVGVPIANRNRVETEGLIGFFVNTQVLRGQIEPLTAVSELLAQVKRTALHAQDHQDLPFEQLVEALQPERSLSHSPLFQVMFNHQAAVREGAAAGPSALPGLSAEGLAWQGHTTQFDLTLNTHENANGFSASLTYATDLFAPATLQAMAAHWLTLLHAMADDPHQRIGDLPMLSREQREQQLQDWNATHVDYALEQSVQQRIEAQVERTPDAVALVFGEQQLSYRQLNSRANQLAHRLIDKGVGADVLVGVAAERSVEMVVALLAILKAGGAYVPLDPEYPRERLAYLFEDSGIGLLLCQAHVRSGLPIPEGLETLVLDDLDDGALHNPQVPVDGQNLAYVIYTSGSTGKPKGAGNSHAALVNRLCWMQDAYALAEGDTVMQKTPFSFDVSVWEFFWPLMTGARLLMAAPGEHRDPARLIELITRHQVTTLHFVPSMLQAFMQDRRVGECTSLQRIICSGEALPVGAQEQVFAKLAQAQLYNLYGPTEAAIDVTHWTCRDEQRDSVPIGVPIANLSTLILDDALDLLPVGAVGELYLGGTGLARGYHRRPGLTAERFIPHPFAAGERLYRTGDLARHRVDGVIDYIGRIDHQVKIRGLRIELGEIEARLLEHPQVREATVIALNMPTGKQLAAYIVGTAPDPSAPEQWQGLLAAHLLQSLPDYMVPAHWVPLERMPLSANGKLDRQALPVPDARALLQAYVAPDSELACKVAAIWQSVLDLERLGMTDHFFRLGGHSLAVVNVVSRISLDLGLTLTPQLLFQFPVLGDFVGQLAQAGEQIDGLKLSKLEALLDEMEEV